MYKVKLWDEDKWDIHSGSYSPSKYGSAFSDDKKDDKKYHEQKYGQKEKDVSSDYMKRQDEKEKEEKDRSHGIFEEMEEEKDRKQELKEEEIPLKAARQVFDEGRHGLKKTSGRKDVKTIEDAIKEAIEEEKKVIIIDN